MIQFFAASWLARRNPLKWNRDAIADGTRPRVFCASWADVFEDWRGDILDSKDRRLYTDRARTCILPETPQGSFENMRPLRMWDLRVDLFKLIDATQQLDWLLLTKRPENIRQTWGTCGCEGDYCTNPTFVFRLGPAAPAGMAVTEITESTEKNY